MPQGDASPFVRTWSAPPAPGRVSGFAGGPGGDGARRGLGQAAAPRARAPCPGGGWGWGRKGSPEPAAVLLRAPKISSPWSKDCSLLGRGPGPLRLVELECSASFTPFQKDVLSSESSRAVLPNEQWLPMGWDYGYAYLFYCILQVCHRQHELRVLSENTSETPAIL